MEQWIIFALAAVFAFGVATGQAFGENYTYNLTDQEREEIMLSEVCLNTSIYLDKCEFIVGKLNSTYGEPVNASETETETEIKK